MFLIQMLFFSEPDGPRTECVFAFKKIVTTITLKNSFFLWLE